MKHWATSRAACGAALLLLSVSVAGATTVVPMPVATLADHAGQVILGEVSAARSYWADNPRRIETEVRFTGVEYLKGALPGATPEFTLIVPGGTVGTVTARIGCAPEFAVGERWLLFLLPEYRTFPTVGVAQGAFRISTDVRSVPRVYSAESEAIVGFDSEGFPQTALARTPSTDGSRLVASRGIRAQIRRSPPPIALPLGEFRARLVPVLAASRDHGLTQPAGRPVVVAPHARPLRMAPGAAPVTGPLRGLGAAVEVPGPADRPRPEVTP